MSKPVMVARLTIAVKVEEIFTNFDIQIPITLGTEPLPHFEQQQQEQTAHTYVFIFNSSTVNDDDDTTVQNIR